MNGFSNEYKIRRVLKTNDEDYTKALQIYNLETPPEIKTDSNQITYWLDNNKTNDYFNFLVFVIYLDNEVIGFIELGHFDRERFVIIDYISLKPPFRKNTVFFPVLSLIQNYFISNNLQVDYYVTEINNKENGEDIDKESLFFKKLICMEDFGILNINYTHPPLGVNNNESIFESKLYIKSNDRINKLKRDTVLRIVKTIYFSYYFEWYKPKLTPDEQKVYQNNLETYYNKLLNDLKSRDNVVITHAECANSPYKLNENTSGTVCAKKSSIKGIKNILLLLAAVVFPVIIILIYNYVLNKFNVNIATVSDAIGNIVSALLASSITFITFKKANNS